MTLVEFLLARIAEDEVAADAAHRESMRGHAGPGFIRSRIAWAEQAESVRGRGLIERMTPARVLAECEAKRRIVKREQTWRPRKDAPPYSGPLTDPFADDPRTRHPDLVAYIDEHCELVTDTPTLRDLASVYADHPDCDAAWQP